MTKLNKHIPYWNKDFGKFFREEFKKIATSYAILLLLVGGLLIYGFLYNLMYKPNLVRNAPIAVVNVADSKIEREYIMLIDATPQLKVMYSLLYMNDAEEYIQQRKVQGAFYLPTDFANTVMRDAAAVGVLYGNTAAFLYYEAMQEALSGAMLAINDKLRPIVIEFIPPFDKPFLSESSPIEVSGTPLYNPTMGYGTYLLPGVLMIILFQVMMMAVAMSIGGSISDGSILKWGKHGIDFSHMSRIVLGYGIVYFLIFMVFSIFMLGLIPLIFNLPHLSKAIDISFMMVPFLLSTCFLSLAFSVFYTDMDQPLLMITFFSVPLVFLSGISYPLELMPWYWQGGHFIFPGSTGALAFVKLNSMGASLVDIREEYISMWIQCVVYFFLACWAMRFNMKRVKKRLRQVKPAIIAKG